MGGLGKPLPHPGDRQQCPLCMASSANLRHPPSCPLPGKGQLAQVSEEWAQQLLGWKGDGGAVPQLLLLLPVEHHHQGCPLWTNLKSLHLIYWVMAMLSCPYTSLGCHMPPPQPRTLSLLGVMCLMESKPFAEGLKPHFPPLYHPGQVSS